MPEKCRRGRSGPGWVPVTKRWRSCVPSWPPTAGARGRRRAHGAGGESRPRARSASPDTADPHAGEFARLSGRRWATTGWPRCALATELGRDGAAQGPDHLVATPEGLVYGNDAGSSWAATAGAGDVLTGIAGSLLAAGLEPVVGRLRRTRSCAGGAAGKRWRSGRRVGAVGGRPPGDRRTRGARQHTHALTAHTPRQQ